MVDGDVEKMCGSGWRGEGGGRSWIDYYYSNR